MSQSTKTITPTVFGAAPTSVTFTPSSPPGANPQMYTFYGRNNTVENKIGMTFFDGSRWTSTNLTGGGGVIANAPAPVDGNKIESIMVGGVICVAYQSSTNAITVLTNWPNAWAVRATYSVASPGVINNFCLYTDNNYLYILTNESGTLYTNRLNNNVFDSKTKVNGQASGGLAVNAPKADSKSPLCAAYLAPGYLHIAYETSGTNFGTVDVYQNTATTWTLAYIKSDSSGLGESINFFSYNNDFYAAVSDDFGYINVYKFINGQALPWSKVYQYPTSPSNYAVGSISTGVVNNGAYIAFRDNNNTLNLLYTWNGSPWTLINLSSLTTPANPPLMKGGPGVVIWNNGVYHAVYPTTNNTIYDVFWWFGWFGAELYPTTPFSTAALTSMGSAGDAQMV